MPNEPVPDRRWTDARAVEAEGARIGFVTCLRCGACVVIDPTDTKSPIVLHDNWHIGLRISHAAEQPDKEVKP